MNSQGARRRSGESAAGVGPPDTSTRNLAPSYGLTLVAGAPLPPGLTCAVLRFQQTVEAAAPGCFRWYEAPQLHVTLAAPVRGRYRHAPPLRRSELPDRLEALFGDLAATCRALPPLEMALGAPEVRSRTLLFEVEGGAEHAALLRELIARHPGWDEPKGGPLHLSAGFLLPQVDEERAANAVGSLQRAAAGPVAGVDEIALVHYANRTLSKVVGEVRLPLGRSEARSPTSFLSDLHIAD